MIYWLLFIECARVSLLAIGGGLVALPLMQATFIEKYGWLTETEFLDMLAISQSTPGPISINLATFIGYQQAGFGGALIATFGMVLPSLVIIIILSQFLEAYKHLPAIQKIFNGIRPCATGLIASVTLYLFNVAVWGPSFSMTSLLLFGLATVLIMRTKTHPILLIVIGAIAGVLIL